MYGLGLHNFKDIFVLTAPGMSGNPNFSAKIFILLGRWVIHTIPIIKVTIFLYFNNHWRNMTKFTFQGVCNLPSNIKRVATIII